MKREFKKIVSMIMLVVMTMMSTMTVSAEPTEHKTATHYNVMLVVDGSGSLTREGGTDTQGYRYNAIKAFLGVLTNAGNRVGAIVFNHEQDMPLLTDLKKMESLKDKEALSNQIQTAGADGDTDIGYALEKALEQLQGAGADPELPSCILLFSDGETDLGDPQATQASLERKDAAVLEAQRLGIPIHGICLNTNQVAKTQEVKGIADSTGGIYLELTDASDLFNVFVKFYSMIYREEPVPGEVEMPARQEFQIPEEGVVEVNVFVSANGVNREIGIIRPSGVPFTSQEVAECTMNVGEYDLVKIVNPETGLWTLTVDGAPGAKIFLSWIYNTDLSAEIECDADNLMLNDSMEVKGYLLSENKRINNPKAYNEYQGTLILTNAKTGEKKEFIMDTDGTCFKTDVSFEEYGTYYATIQLVYGDISHTSESTRIDVGNNPPKASSSYIKEKIIRLPFKSLKAEFDLDEYVTDPEGDAISYELGKYTFDADKVELKDSTLKVDAKGQKDGTVNITAIDSQGAGCEIVFRVTTFNLGLLILVILILIILIVLIIVLVKQRKKASTIFTGTITVSSFNDNNGTSSQPFPQTGVKGKRNLREWQVCECGIEGDFVAVFVRGRKEGDLKFVSKKGFLTEAGQKANEIKFTIGDEVRIFAPSENPEDTSRGIKVIISDNMGW